MGFAVAAEKSPILTDFLHTLTSLKTACIAGCRSIKLLAGCSKTQLIPLADAKRMRRATRAHMVFPALTEAADSSPSGDVADRRVLPLDLARSKMVGKWAWKNTVCFFFATHTVYAPKYGHPFTCCSDHHHRCVRTP